jgi:hypothetical protein
MRVLYSPQIGLTQDRITYRFDGDIIIATYRGVEDSFDFSGMPDGKLQWGVDAPPPITSILEVVPVVDAERRDGVLYVTLLNVIDENSSTYEDRFPEWVEV